MTQTLAEYLLGAAAVVRAHLFAFEEQRQKSGRTVDLAAPSVAVRHDLDKLVVEMEWIARRLEAGPLDGNVEPGDLVH